MVDGMRLYAQRLDAVYYQDTSHWLSREIHRVTALSIWHKLEVVRGQAKVTLGYDQYRTFNEGRKVT